MENRAIDRVLILVGIAILFVLAYLTLKALIIPLFLAFILGYLFRPAYNSLYRIIKLKGLSALIIIFGLIALIIIPLTFLMPSLIKQTFELYLKIQNLNIGDSLKTILPSTISPEILTAINLQFNNILARLFSSIMNSFSSFLTDLPIKILTLTIFLLLLYFVLIDFDKICNSLSEFIPLSKENRTKFYFEFRNVTEGILYGQVLIGILQGVMMGMMLFILNIEGKLLFTIVAIVAGILPMVGPTIIWIPLGIVLIVSGLPIQAIVLALWGMMVTGITDGILRPYILSKRTLLPIAWGFISTIGGILAFGMVGLLLGPLIIAYSIIILQFYKQKRFNELFRE
jgi:predicted PurR-regulated permease PerM